jgi:tetratricopeptide (TPR) repeat protein
MHKNEGPERNEEPMPGSGLMRRAYPRNPIGVIALFVFFIEAIATASLKFLLDANSPYAGHIVFFILGFPVLLVILFFGTLWMRRESLYSPSDFREDANFIQLFRRVDARVEKVEIRQRAAQLDPRGDPADVFAVIPDLLARNDIETVVSLGRAFLKVKRYSNSLDVFRLLARLPLSPEVQSQVMAFTAYCLNGLGLYQESIQELKELRKLDPALAEKFWPSLASAYSHFKLGQRPEFSAWLDKAASRNGAPEYLELAIQLYPELRDPLKERLSMRQESTQ